MPVGVKAFGIESNGVEQASSQPLRDCDARRMLRPRPGSSRSSCPATVGRRPGNTRRVIPGRRDCGSGFDSAPGRSAPLLPSPHRERHEGCRAARWLDLQQRCDRARQRNRAQYARGDKRRGHDAARAPGTQHTRALSGPRRIGSLMRRAAVPEVPAAGRARRVAARPTPRRCRAASA